MTALKLEGAAYTAVEVYTGNDDNIRVLTLAEEMDRERFIRRRGLFGLMRR